MCSTRNCRACPRNSVRSSCSATWTDRRRRRSPVNPANWTTNALAMEVNTSGRDSAFSAVTQGNCSFDDRENEHHPASMRERSAQPPCRRERTGSFQRRRSAWSSESTSANPLGCQLPAGQGGGWLPDRRGRFPHRFVRRIALGPRAAVRPRPQRQAGQAQQSPALD